MARRRTSVALWGHGHLERKLLGSIVLNDNIDPTFRSYVSVCDDGLGPGVDHALQIERTDIRGIQGLSGRWGVSSGSGGSYRLAENWPSPIQRSPPAHLATSIPSVGEVATACLARSNPSQPDVSLPNFLFELRDLPGMIRDIGKLKLLLGERQKLRGPLRESAAFYLSYQMGWRPLISDLQKLLEFQALVDKKMRELERLYNNGGLHRKVKSDSWTQTVTSSQGPKALESGIDSNIMARSDTMTSIRRWATVRWIPASLPSTKLSNQELHKLARSLAFGTRIGTTTVWDAIPWTWLVDWFANVGDFVKANDNRIPLSHSTPCVMTHVETKCSWTRVDTVPVNGGNGTALRESKSRTLSSGSLTASLPFLDRRQVSILGALAIQRSKR